VFDHEERLSELVAATVSVLDDVLAIGDEDTDTYVVEQPAVNGARV
jgi:hypothetical protein